MGSRVDQWGYIFSLETSAVIEEFMAGLHSHWRSTVLGILRWVCSQAGNFEQASENKNDGNHFGMQDVVFAIYNAFIRFYFP